MRVVVTGATGFIGSRVVQKLHDEGHQVVVLSRNGEKAKQKFSFPVEAYQWNPEKEPAPLAALENSEGVIHLAGASVGEGRWTKSQKQEIFDSRVKGTQNLILGIKALTSPPKVLVTSSAIGFYGDRGDEILTEKSLHGGGFLSEVCQAWEKEANQTPASVRSVQLRTGIVLGKGGGALGKLLPIFKAGVGGKAGSGKQWMSWIHLDDMAALYLYALNSSLSGPVNAVAPQPVTNSDFSHALGRALNRPALVPAPALALKLALGEASELVLGSQRVSSALALNSGFQFKYPEINSALDAVVQEKG